MKSPNFHKNQNGAATLLTALVLLIGITLVTLLSSKTVLMETQIAADNYRMAQAVAAANAALDFGIGYFDGTATKGDGTATTDNVVVAGFDHDIPPDGVDIIGQRTYTSSDGSQTTTATLTFNNAAGTRCVPAGATANMKSGLITAVGFSDDRLAQRTISQCVGTLNVFGGNSPKQSMVSRGGVGITGNVTMINRFNNTTIWSGSEVKIGNSNSAATYMRPVGTRESDYTKAQLEDRSTGNTYTSQAISARDKGNGVDTIDNDPGLRSLTSDEFFNNFFYGDRTMMENLAKSLDQRYTDIGSADGKSGVVWIEGDADIRSGGTYGTADSPVILIINGNLQASGNPNINGLLYVRGQLDAAGTIGVLGSVVVEGDPALVPVKGNPPVPEDPVKGGGGVDLVYTPYTLDRSGNPIVGTTTAISGSWRDWEQI